MSAAMIQETALRDALGEKLAQCTDAQVVFFHRIYGAEVPAEKLAAAYGLVERTIEKNERLGRS